MIQRDTNRVTLDFIFKQAQIGFCHLHSHKLNVPFIHYASGITLSAFHKL